MALGDLTLRQAQILRLLRDCRPAWVLSDWCRAEGMCIHYRVMRHLMRLGFADVLGGPGVWSATITPKGVARLALYHRTNR